MVKKAAWLVLLVLISINSFGAIVSDNDGPSFITKADFESLKKDFNEQIDKYNNSIDGKIDGAIANYLAGIGIQKKTIFDPIVSNYADINWVRKWCTYGSYITFTSETDYTKTLHAWFEPFMDKFIPTRDDYLNIKGYGGRFEGSWAFEIGGNWRFDLADGPVLCNWNDSLALKPSQNLIKCQYEEIMNRIVVEREPFVTTGSLHDRFAASYKLLASLDYSNDNGATWIATNGGSSYTPLPFHPMEETHTRAADWLANNPLGTDEILNVTIMSKYNDFNTTTGFQQLARWNWNPKSWELDIGKVYSYNELWVGTGARGNGMAVDINSSAIPSRWDHTNAHVWTENPHGLHACQLEQESVQENDFINMMLGCDSDKVVNMRRQHEKRTTANSEFPETKYEKSDWCIFPVEFSWLSTTGKRIWSADDTTYVPTYPVHKIINLRIPYEERATLSELCGGQFYNQKTPLKFGEGLPLITDMKNTGDITIEFDYSLSRSIGTVPSTAKSIEVDLKKSNFLSDEKDDFYIGVVGDAATGEKIKDVEINTTTRHAKIVIDEADTKVGNELWMRIKPKAETEGLKAKISNLKVSMLEN